MKLILALYCQAEQLQSSGTTICFLAIQNSTFQTSDDAVPAGDDAIAIHGRMYTVAASQQSQSTLTLGSNVLNTDELNTGDSINVYNPAGRLLGSATVSTMTATTAPVPATTQDQVFGGTFEGYTYYKASMQGQPACQWTCPFQAVDLFLTCTQPEEVATSVNEWWRLLLHLEIYVSQSLGVAVCITKFIGIVRVIELLMHW